MIRFIDNKPFLEQKSHYDDIIWCHISVEDNTNVFIRLIVLTLLEVVLKNFTWSLVLKYTIIVLCYIVVFVLLTDVPVVALELSSNVNVSAIKEGMDVFFECNVKSNPWIYRVNWHHNVSWNTELC